MPTKTSSRSAKSAGFKFLITLGILALVGGAAYFVYFAKKYNDHRLTSQRSIELPGLQMYSVQDFDYNKIFSLYVNYPKIDKSAFDNRAKQIVDKEISAFRAEVSDNQEGAHPTNDLNISYHVDYYNDEFLSVSLLARAIVDGKSSQNEQTILYDRKQNKVIELADLFTNNSNYLTVLSDQTRAKLKDVLGTNYNQALAEKGTEPSEANFAEFIVDTKRNLVLIFEPGKVAAADVGEVQVKISANDLATILNKPYANNLLKVAAVKLSPPVAPAAQQTTGNVNGAVPQADPSGVNCATAKCIALTFDDGPSYTTPQLLDILKANNVKATFFELGIQAQKYPTITKRVVAEGHVIGNHTYDHQNLLAMSLADAEGEIGRAADIIQAAGGVRPGLVRAPYGAVNQTLANEVGAPFINWSVDPDDWRDRDADIVYQRVMANAKPGAIVLSHDIYQTTVDAYEKIIPDLINQGYILVTVPQLLGFGENVSPGIYFSR